MRVHEQGAGDGQALLLAAAERGAAFADGRFVAFGEVHDEVVRRRRFGGGNNLLFAGVRTAEGDVVANGAAEKRGLLQNDADLGAQAVDGHVAHVVAVDRDRAIADVIEARNEIDDRRLAAARGAQQSNRLARLGDEADAS